MSPCFERSWRSAPSVHEGQQPRELRHAGNTQGLAPPGVSDQDAEGVELAAERQPTAGLRVLSIDSGSAAADRLYQGDLITAVNQRSVGDVARARELADETRTVVLEIERNARKQLIRIR